MKIDHVTLWRLKVPLYEPYNLSLAALSELDSIVAELRDADGRTGFGDCTVIPGYTPETGDGAWRFCLAHAARLPGMDVAAAKASFDPFRSSDPHAVSVLQVALEMLEANPLLDAPAEETRVPILSPVNSKDHRVIPDEIERLLAQGYRTLKVKVGWDVDKDLERLKLIQRVNAGRAALRLDANQGFSAADGIRFARALDPASIELFEQPCHCDDWDANAAVAAASPVPVMMDESIYGFADIDRAAAMPGCGYVKLKISKMTGVDLLAEGLRRIRRKGLHPVLGNGAATDIGCWVEACIARREIDNAGEMCGFLKNRSQLLETPLVFEDGAILLTPGERPRLDHGALHRQAVATQASSRHRR